MRSSGVEFRKPTETDIRFVAEHMRAEDRRELIRWTGQEPEYELRRSVALSDVCWAGVAPTGDVLAIFGATMTDLMDGTATVWSLSTDAVGANLKAFVRGSREALDLVMRSMPEAYGFRNWVDCEYAGACRWLERLGFGRDTRHLYNGPFGGVFNEFYILNEYNKEG